MQEMTKVEDSKKREVFTLLEGMQSDIDTVKDKTNFSLKINRAACNPTISSLVTHLRETKPESQGDICMSMFTSPLFTIARNINNPIACQITNYSPSYLRN